MIRTADRRGHDCGLPVGKADIKAAWQDQRHGGTDGEAGSYGALRCQYERRVRRTVEEPEYYVFEPSECAAKA